MTEEWRPTHNPTYEVSNLGRVRSYAVKGSKYGRQNLVPHILKAGIDSFGYPQVVLENRRNYRVHSLVTAAFIGPCPKGQEVMHGDDTPANVRLSNLSYGTRARNQQDCTVRGRRNTPRGEHSSNVILNSKQVQTIRVLSIYATYQEIAQWYGVSKSTISHIVLRLNWAHVL